MEHRIPHFLQGILCWIVILFCIFLVLLPIYLAFSSTFWWIFSEFITLPIAAILFFGGITAIDKM